MGLGFLHKTGVTSPRSIQSRSSGTGARKQLAVLGLEEGRSTLTHLARVQGQVRCAAQGNSARRMAGCVRAGEGFPYSVTEFTFGGTHCMADPHHWVITIPG